MKNFTHKLSNSNNCFSRLLFLNPIFRLNTVLKTFIVGVFLFLNLGNTYGQYLEDFPTADRGIISGPCGGTASSCSMNDFTGVDWDINGNFAGILNNEDFVKTIAGVLTYEDIDEEVCWESPVLDISAVAGTFSLSVDATWFGFDADDFIDIEYNIDGGGWTQIPNVIGGASGTIQFGVSAVNEMGSTTVTQLGLSGTSTLSVRACGDINLGTINGTLFEQITIDNVSVPEAGVVIMSVSTIVCPTVGAVSTNPSSTCPNGSFNITATSLATMDMASNMEQDFGIEFVAFAATPADPYVGGTSLGTVPFGSLTGGGTSAALTGASLGTAGSYEIYAILSPTPTDGTCRPSAMTSISVSSALSSSASVTMALACNGDTDGQVTASGSGGTMPYTYSWNTGETNAIETNLSANTYSVTITDQNGCTDSATITLMEPTALSSSASVTMTLDCNGDTDGQVMASGSGGTTPYTYSWNTGETNATETNLSAGTYSVTITDQNGCTDSASTTLTQPTVLSSSAAVTSVLDCNGDSDGQLTASGSGGTTPYTYSWNTGETNATETNLSAGTYSVTITDQNGCTDSASTTLTQPTVLSSSAAVTSVLDCNGDSDGQLTASATGGTTPYTYSWNTGETNATETNLSAGTYSVTITDQNGCTDSASTTLTQPTVLSSSAAVTSVLDCNGDSDGQLTASGSGGTTPYTYSWNTGETNATETNLSAGTYSVTITDQNGCTDSASTTLTQPTVLSSSAAVTSVLDCNGDSDGQLTASATGGTTPYTYSWNTGETNAIETNLSANTYSVTITDQNGCTDSATITLMEPTALSSSASVTMTLDCNGDTDGQVMASGSGGTTPYTYSWNTGGTAPLETGLSAGTYSVTVTDQNGCTDSASTTLTEPTVLVASAVVDSTVSCNGFSDGGATASGSGGTMGYTYSWSNGATTASVTGVSAGTYSVTITDQNGCTDSASTTLTQPVVLVASAAVDSTVSCNGFSDGGASASASGGTMAYTYSWSNAATTASITGVGAGTYSVTITDQNGCTDSASISLSVQDTVPPTAVCQDITVTLDGSGNASITASDLDGGSADNCGSVSVSIDSTDASFTCVDVGSNTITLTAMDANGNVATCTSNVTVQDTTPPTAVCQDITVFLDGSGNASIMASDLDGGSADNCGSVSVSIDSTDASFTCVDVGSNTITLTAMDANGNVATCTSNVTVQDTTPPTAVCQDITVFLDGSGNASIMASDLDGGSADNCGSGSVSVSIDSTDAFFTCVDVGSNTVTLTAMDANGNLATCTSNVTVQDTTPPTAVCQDITVTLDASGNASITASDLDGGSADNCGSVSVSIDSTDASFTCVDVGSNTVTLTAMDANGSIATCTSNVTVQDTTPPTAVCQDITVTLDASGNASITASDLDGGSADNCVSVSVSIDSTDASFTCVDVGSNTITLTAMDANGNLATCTSNVTVQDTTPPTAVCQDITVSSMEAVMLLLWRVT